jgi:hypothetical protein
MPTPEAARRTIDSLEQAGAVFLKLHGCDSAKMFFVIAAAQDLCHPKGCGAIRW